MKTKILRGWRWMFAIASSIALLGCLDRPGNTNAQAALDIPPNDEVAETPIPDEAPPLKAVIPPADLSPGLSELIKLAESGVGDEVVLAYIDKLGHPLNPTVDEIVYLKDLGLSEPVIAALIRPRDGTNLVAQVAPAQQENMNPVQAPAANLTATEAPSSVAAEPIYTPPLTPPTEQVNYNYFESTLSPYGSWVDVPVYGRCWQPTVVVVNRSWRPYSDRGRWLYTSAGWYWQSDYSWGWAPFHYGRWHCDNRIGWVWSPDVTWGPAWVSWRYTDQYCGWAPLPPAAHYDGFGFRYHNAHVGISFDFGLHDDCYTFIPTSRFCDRTPHRYYVSGSHSKTIYKNSVVINNYVRGNNNTVINEGIGRDRVSKATRTPVRTVALRDLPTTSTPVGRSERLEGNSLSVFRPNVTRQASLTHSRTSLARETLASSPSGVPQRSVPSTGRTETVQSNKRETPTAPTTVASRGNSPTRETLTASGQSTPNPSVMTRSVPSAGRTQTAPFNQRETPAAPTTAPSSSQPQRTFPRTWSQPSSITRNSSSEADQRQLLAGQANNTPSSSGENQSTRGNSGWKQLSATQDSAPIQRRTPSIIPENPRAREAALTPQQSARVMPSVPAAPQVQPARREVNAQPVQNNSTPRASRSIPSVQQPSYGASDNWNRGSRVERSAPQVMAQPSPRVSTPSVSAPRAQPQQQPQRVQTQPQRSQQSLSTARQQGNSERRN